MNYEQGFFDELVHVKDTLTNVITAIGIPSKSITLQKSEVLELRVAVEDLYIMLDQLRERYLQIISDLNRKEDEIKSLKTTANIAMGREINKSIKLDEALAKIQIMEREIKVLVESKVKIAFNQNRKPDQQ